MMAKRSIAALLAAACFIATFGLAVADAPQAPAPAAPQNQLIIDNHQKNISVKDQNGQLLFAELIDTPNMVLQLSGSDKSGTMEIKDGTGKSLWSHPFSMNTFLAGDWSQQGNGSAFTSWYSDNDTSKGFSGSGTLTIGPDDQVVGIDFREGGGFQMFFSPSQGQLFMKAGKMSAQASFNQDHVTLDMINNGVHTTMVSTKHDGKDCLQVNVGKQTIYIMSGGSFTFDSKGDLIFTPIPSQDSSQPQTTADAKSDTSQ